jgi:hypothetical protein
VLSLLLNLLPEHKTTLPRVSLDALVESIRDLGPATKTHVKRLKVIGFAPAVFVLGSLLTSL